MALPPSDQRQQYRRFEGLHYTEGDIADFETRLAKIYRREVHRVQVFDFGGLSDLMAEGFREVVLDLDTVRALQFHELGGGFFGYTPSYTLIRDPILRLCHRLIACSIARRSQAPKKVTAFDVFYLRGMDVGTVNVPYLLARYLRLFALGRKQDAIYLVIFAELDDTWALVAPGPERQPDGAASAPEAAKDVPIADEGASAIPASLHAPHSPPPAARPTRTMAQMLARVEEDMHEIRGELDEQRDWIAGIRYTSYADLYERCTRCRTDGASIFTTQQDEQQPDP
uniref:Uncharacterized protein n=1 Tax=Tanacetum cinerariifolium TaxID=118510 RepID=A0A699IXF6_TANCI|nr:hypothetical protein [Tanacetum cinerariifolium]